ncbi:MAG TPA: hypothetical protein VL053_06175, partial [Arachidicoccus sp.]|nr:hypothetical protein [Arachidicoccus sp.]
RDQFYVQILGKGIYIINENDQLIPLSTDTLLQRKRVTMILPYGSSQLLIGTDKDGLVLYTPGIDKYTPFNSALSPVFITGEINSGVKIKDDLFAIGTIGKGVVFMDAGGAVIATANKETGLLNNTILDMELDQSGNLWLAMDKGIAQLILKSNVAYYKDLQGRIGTVYAVAIYQGRIYVGSNHGLYEAEFNGLEDFSLTDLSVFPGISGQVWDLKVIDGQLFCGNNTGTYVIKDNQARKIYAATGGWDLQMVPAGKGQNGLATPQCLLQGTYNGIAVYRKTGGRWQFSHLLKGTENMAINKVVVAGPGRIWAMHAYKGIFVLQTDTAYTHVEQMKAVPVKSTSQPTDRWNLFAFDGGVRINGPAGIYKYDFQSGTLTKDQALTEKFRPFAKAERILPDGNENAGCWFIDEQNHVHYRNLLSGAITDFPLNGNLFNLVPGFESIIPVSASESILTGEDGFVVLHKNQRNSPTSFAAPQVQEVRLVQGSKTATLPAKYLQPDGHLELPYRLNNLILLYCLPNYDRPVTYSYRFGKDDAAKWSEMSASSQKEFNNLAPGLYHFQVKTQLSDKVSTLTIRILNPWYFSIVARIIYLIALILFNMLIWRWHKHRLKVQQEALTLKMQEALALEQEKSANKLLLLEQEKLSDEVIHKSEDLAKLAMELIKKKKVLKKLKEELEEMKKQKDQGHVGAQIQKLSKSLNRYIKDEQDDWRLFDNGFNRVHEAFFEKLLQEFPELTSQDLRLAAYLKMNLTTKEIAPLLNISIRGVEIKRYRLRKKLQLGIHDNLSDFMLRY